jgi:hypothetical protein
MNDDAGPRYLTMLVYLSELDEGGETMFSKLGVEVTPKAGHAVLWPNLVDEAPLGISMDNRTWHESKPVVQGMKYVMNVWPRMHTAVQGPIGEKCASFEGSVPTCEKSSAWTCHKEKGN